VGMISILNTIPAKAGISKLGYAEKRIINYCKASYNKKYYCKYKFFKLFELISLDFQKIKLYFYACSAAHHILSSSI